MAAHARHPASRIIMSSRSGALDVDQNVSPAVIGFNVNAHVLAKATLTDLCGR